MGSLHNISFLFHGSSLNSINPASAQDTHELSLSWLTQSFTSDNNRPIFPLVRISTTALEIEVACYHRLDIDHDEPSSSSPFHASEYAPRMARQWVEARGGFASRCVGPSRGVLSWPWPHSVEQINKLELPTRVRTPERSPPLSRWFCLHDGAH
jgi:hypothetical protein